MAVIFRLEQKYWIADGFFEDFYDKNAEVIVSNLFNIVDCHCLNFEIITYICNDILAFADFA